ncbi:hypothetical protein INR49_016541 [Caranx melampygus]|nr:hypothetical protein INR49_016541 [Caranx melampygus]
MNCQGVPLIIAGSCSDELYYEHHQAWRLAMNVQARCRALTYQMTERSAYLPQQNAHSGNGFSPAATPTFIEPAVSPPRSQTCEQTSFDWVCGVIGISYQATAWHMSPSSGHKWKSKRQSTCTAAFVVDGAVLRAHSETKCENAATGPPLLSLDWLLIEALGRVLVLRTPRTRMTGERPCADSRWSIFSGSQILTTTASRGVCSRRWEGQHIFGTTYRLSDSIEGSAPQCCSYGNSSMATSTSRFCSAPHPHTSLRC